MEQLVNFIIRPPRAEYDPNEDLLDEEFMLKGKWYRRKDFEIQNNRGDILKCSHYLPIVSPEGKPLPCVIYCHGNSGCRADGSEAAIILLPSNITVFTLDFSGSGLSGGEHVTLGWNEKDDLKAVVDYLRADGNVSLIGLWGRSMGAVTSLMYGAEDPSIAGMVLDSPFSDLVELMMELVDTYKVRLPKFTVKFAIQYMRRVIQKKAKFDIMDLNTIKVAKACFVPLLLGHAVDDDFIQPHHSDHIFEAYMGDKNIIRFEGDHNSPRPQFYFDSINIFFHNVLHPPEDEGTFLDSIPDYIGKGLWRTMPEEGYEHVSSSTPKDESTSSTADAIEQVRSKRPMSRTEVPSDIPTVDGNCNPKDMNVRGGHSPSSSNMISFELSNGHPYGPHVPTSLDEDQYVEYQLDDLAGFPSNAEEEDRMLMEAVMESLKDLEIRCLGADQPSAISSRHVDPLEKDHQDDASMENTTPFAAESSCRVEDILPSSTDVEPILTGPKSQPMSLTNKQTSASEHPSPELNQSSAGFAMDTCPAVKESGSKSTITISKNSSRIKTQSSSDTDVSDTTKATLTVEKNPPTNIMDGFMRRLDLSFFRHSQNR